MRLILIDLKKARKKNLKTSNSILFHRLLMIIISFVVFYGFSFRFASAFSLLTLCYCVSLCSIWVFFELIYFSAWSSLGFLFAFFSITQRRLQVRPSPRTFHFFLFIVLTALLTVSHVASDSATLCSSFHIYSQVNNRFWNRKAKSNEFFFLLSMGNMFTFHWLGKCETMKRFKFCASFKVHWKKRTTNFADVVVCGILFDFW